LTDREALSDETAEAFARFEAGTPEASGTPASAGAAGDVEPSTSLLLVESDPLAAKRLFEMLTDPTRTRFQITHVWGVEEALEKLQHVSFDVLLLDLSIHERYGLDSLLRARVAAQSVPIVILTYQDDEELASKAVRAGAQDYLIKGEVTPALLSRTLRHAVERHRMLRELTEAQQRQHFLATHDALTGLPNRHSFAEDLGSSIADARRRASRVAVLFFDLDGFKTVNDNLGHSAGDELLADVAQRLRRHIRKSDLVARLGGDEFVAAIRDIADLRAPFKVAEEIREELRKTYHINGIECWISASIGIAVYPQDGSDADALISHADAAMYHSKSAGRDHVSFFQSQMNDRAVERFSLVNGLREAIREGGLHLDFQPQIDVATETIAGAEALVRWEEPRRGLVAPREFIAIAEDTGMMIPLGEWVLREACSAAVAWEGVSRGTVSVNVSLRQLEQEDFPERVARLLDETGLPAGRLELELTESIAARESNLAVLMRLREVGVRIAIDDFGTGYSSLHLLKSLPVDTLKIDQSFVRGACRPGRDAIILESIVRLGRLLGLNVVAEGVETAEELEALTQLGCTRMQGYYLGKPTSRQDFDRETLRADAAWRIAIAGPAAWCPPPADPDADEDAMLPALLHSPRS
jgi:diguanylate cyclase (GGDEF)-like protein